MSAGYEAILWNRQKKLYDKYLWIGIALFLIVYAVLQLVLQPGITAETLIIRGTGLTAFLLLHIILIIGPLCRIDDRFLPLLYNRRHMGVSMFFISLIHGAFTMIQFHALGDTNPFLSLFTSNLRYTEINAFPFQVLGFFALIIFFIMAATSHDFWLKNLSPRIWKALHMMVYLAYGLIIVHVATGAFQYESHPANWIILFSGFILVSGLHLYAGVKTNKALADQNQLKEDGFYNACKISEINTDCAKVVFIDGENIALFKYDDKISAVHNVCKHQMGPLGEGRVIDGCITCPWHGYQYRPEDGQSPPPFTEKVKTYATKVLGQDVWVNPNPNPEGTFVEPAKINQHA